MAKKNKVFKVYCINPNWDFPERDYYQTEYTLKDAIDLKKDLQRCGYIKVCIKQRKN